MSTQRPIEASHTTAASYVPAHGTIQSTRTWAAISVIAASMAVVCGQVHAATMLQSDLRIEKIGQIPEGPPSQMVFGPDGRLYVALANFTANAVSAVSFA